MSHIAHICHTCHTYATHISHLCHTCHTYATHMSHICHTHVTHISHMSHKSHKCHHLKTRKSAFRPLRDGLKRAHNVPSFGFSGFSHFSGNPILSGECVLYRPLFMANHFSNDRPNGGPRFEGFLARSPEDQKNTIFRVPKMGNSGIREVSQNWEKCTFQDSQKSRISGNPSFSRISRISQESQLFQLFPMWDTVGSPDLPDLPDFPKSMPNLRSEHVKTQEMDDILRNIVFQDTIISGFSEYSLKSRGRPL